MNNWKIVYRGNEPFYRVEQQSVNQNGATLIGYTIDSLFDMREQFGPFSSSTGRYAPGVRQECPEPEQPTGRFQNLDWDS